MSLQGKTVIVTGSTSGIGEGMAKAFAREGCNVVLNGLGHKDEIETLRRSIEKEFSVKILYKPADMTKPEEIKKMIDDTAQELGRLDIIVNNAGIQHVAPIEEFPVEKWNAIIAINLSSAFHMIRSAVPHLKKQGWGRIISTGSAHSLVASPFKSAYVAAKHGIAGLTKTVALELAQHNITCNAICPGYVETPLVKGQIADQAQSRGISEDKVVSDVILAAEPTKKFTTIEDVAALALYLCSDNASNITGSMISIDGGWIAE
jgi:3-hydroxybutyrate dehydrogenase